MAAAAGGAARRGAARRGGGRAGWRGTARRRGRAAASDCPRAARPSQCAGGAAITRASCEWTQKGSAARPGGDRWGPFDVWNATGSARPPPYTRQLGRRPAARRRPAGRARWRAARAAGRGGMPRARAPARPGTRLACAWPPGRCLRGAAGSASQPPPGGGAPDCGAWVHGRAGAGRRCERRARGLSGLPSWGLEWGISCDLPPLLAACVHPSPTPASWTFQGRAVDAALHQHPADAVGVVVDPLAPPQPPRREPPQAAALTGARRRCRQGGAAAPGWLRPPRPARPPGPQQPRALPRPAGAGAGPPRHCKRRLWRLSSRASVG
jgi:hypothetical protein